MTPKLILNPTVYRLLSERVGSLANSNIQVDALLPTGGSQKADTFFGSSSSGVGIIRQTLSG